MSSEKKTSDLASNRKAFHDYEILDTFESGIVLLGTEIKSLRNHGGNLGDAYVLITADQKVVLKGAQIAPYRFGGVFNHEERRDRILLLHKREIAKLKNASSEKGFSLIPLAFYLKNGLVKVKIGVARGKKSYDKRAALKEKEHNKMIERSMRRDS